MNQPFKLTFVVLCLALSARSQTPQWINYSTGRSVNAILQDGDNLWVGTDGGLVLHTISTGQSQFLNKANSGLGYNIINAIAIDRNGKKWIATGAGMCTFDGVTWKKYKTADGLTDYNFTSVAIERASAGDTVWMGFYGGLVRFDGKSFTIFTQQNGLPDWIVTSIVVGADGTKWMGTSSAGLVRFDGSTFISYNLSNSPMPYNYVKDVLVDGANVWAATDGFGAVKFDGTNWTVYSMTTTSGALPSNHVRAIRKGAGSALYFCTEGGLAKLDGGQWTTYKRTAGGLPSDTVTTVTFVAPSTAYVGTPSAGMVSFNGVNWTNRPTSNCALPSNLITKILVDANDVKWIGTDAGIVKIDGSSWQVFNSSNSVLTNNYVSYLTADNQGRVLVGTQGVGLFRWNGTAWENLPNSGEVYQVTAFGVDGKNRLWASGSGAGGFGYNDGSGWSWFPAATTVGGITIPYGATRSILFEKGATVDSETVWIGIDGGGIIKVTGNVWTLYNPQNSGLVHVAIMSMDLENGGPSKQGGALWVATWGGGVFRFDGRIWNRYTAGANAVPHADVGVVMVDSRKTKWIGTFGVGSTTSIEGGIVKLDSNFKFTTRYNTGTSSLPGNYVTDIREDKLGVKWIGTYGWGLAVLNENLAATDIQTGRAPLLPLSMQLFQNYPNPFNPATVISFQLSASSLVTLRVYDILGRVVETMISGERVPGSYTVNFDATSLPSGVYFYDLRANGTLIQAKKMLLLR